MPLVTRTLVIALALGAGAADRAVAQFSTRSVAASSAASTASSTPEPWGSVRPAEPRRLEPTAYQAPLPAPGAAEPNRVAPASGQQPLPISGQQPAPPRGHQPLPLSGRPQQGTETPDQGGNANLKPLVSGAASLGIVLGLFLLVVWSVRRSMPKGAGMLPAEAVEVLGRTSIGSRQFVHLVRCGNKVVLLNVTSTGVEALTEIAEPGEVDRLQEICRHTTSPAGALQQLFDKVGTLSRGAGATNSSDQLDFQHLETGGYHRS